MIDLSHFQYIERASIPTKMRVIDIIFVIKSKLLSYHNPGVIEGILLLKFTTIIHTQIIDKLNSNPPIMFFF